MEITEGTLQNLYTHSRGLEVLVDKTIVFLGDSVMRGMYKDMVAFVKTGNMMTDAQGKRKGEKCFMDDILVYGGDKLIKKTNGKEFREYRVIKCDNGIIVKYHYICRAYNDHVNSILETFIEDPPDIIVVNSCLWDLHRYEKNNKMELFKANVLKLAKSLSNIKTLYSVEPEPPLLIWPTTPPCACDRAIIEDFTEVSDDPNAYNFTAQIDELNSANIWLGQMLPFKQFNVIDLGTVMAKATHNRENDGVHWNPKANRMFTMLILSRVEMHMAKPGKQSIPTIIYSPLLYVAPLATPPPPRAVRAPPPPVPYSDHQYYDGMNEFNDRYSFEAPAQQAPQNYNNEYSGEYVAGNQDYNRGYDNEYGTGQNYGPPPQQQQQGSNRGGYGGGEQIPNNNRGGGFGTYDNYNNNYNYNDIGAAVTEQRQLARPISQSRALQERRQQVRPERVVQRVNPQHRFPPPRHNPRGGPARRMNRPY